MEYDIIMYFLTKSRNLDTRVAH